MLPLLATLISAGPSLIRLFGQSKGGNTERVTETIADVVDIFQNNPNPQNKAKLQSLVESLDPIEIQKIQLGLAQINADREKAVLDHDLAMHQAQQQTLQSTDIKGVRPQIANRHSWYTIAYILVFEGLGAFGHGTGANWEIATLIAAPTLAWFGFRTWDKFSKQGSSN